MSVEPGNEVVLTYDAGTLKIRRVGGAVDRIQAMQIYEKILGADTMELCHVDYSFKPLKPILTMEQPVLRIIAATNTDCEEAVRLGRLRRDLFQRVDVLRIKLPPLRERGPDIMILARHFLKKYAVQFNKPAGTFSSDATNKLATHSWPGNVRELENTIEYAMAMTRDDVIAEDGVLPGKAGLSEERLKPLKEAKEAFEKEYIINILKVTRGNVSSASELAGKYRADFYNLLKKYDINPADFKKEPAQKSADSDA